MLTADWTATVDEDEEEEAPTEFDSEWAARARDAPKLQLKCVEDIVKKEELEGNLLKGMAETEMKDSPELVWGFQRCEQRRTWIALSIFYN